MAAPTKTLSFLMRAKHSGLFINRGVQRYLTTGMRRHVPVAPESGVVRWQLCSAVCLERPAVVTSDMSAMEQEYNDMLRSVELERSVLSDHELRHRSEVEYVEQQKSGDHEEMQALEMTALELEDVWESELNTFTPAPCRTAADESGDKSTHARLLQRKLTLLVRQALGKHTPWMMPQGPRLEGETMRAAAERVLEEKCGPEIKAHFLGNAPVGFYKYKFLNSKDSELVGVKVFFFKALLEAGDVGTRGEDVHEVAWVTHEELGGMVLPRYRQRLHKFLMDL